jgi:hypothetical protein
VTLAAVFSETNNVIDTRSCLLALPTCGKAIENPEVVCGRPVKGFVELPPTAVNPHRKLKVKPPLKDMSTVNDTTLEPVSGQLLRSAVTVILD